MPKGQPGVLRKTRNDLAGKVYGRLTVVERQGSRERNGKIVAAQWLCRCECGEETLAESSHLNKGQKQSCGCLQEEQRALWKKPETNPGTKKKGFKKYLKAHAKFREMRHTATTSRGIMWTIPEEEKYINWLTDDCSYCGIKAGIITPYQGFDRVDSSDYYRVGNVVPCCKYCNRAKNDLTTEEFLDWIIRIHKFQVLGI